MIKRLAIAALLAATAPHAWAQQMSADDAAARFGAREDVEQVSLSPDGGKVAYLTPHGALGSAVHTVDLATGKSQVATAADGKPLRLSRCDWVSNDRLLCTVYALHSGAGQVVGSSRLIAVDADGSDFKLVTPMAGVNAVWTHAHGGSVIDYLPGEDGKVLRLRYVVPEGKVGSLIEKRDEGFGVERVDTRTGATSRVESPKREATEFITDGRGNVRIMGTNPDVGDGYSGRYIRYFYRAAGEDRWRDLSTYDMLTQDGFNPYAVDPVKNVAYGLKKKDGRLAAYSVALDETRAETLLHAHPAVDVDNFVRVGRDRRVVGVSFATDKREVVYLDNEVGQMAAALSKALPATPVTHVVDASLDGNKLLLWAGSDVDPGSYYLFDRRAKRLNKLMLARPQLEKTRLAEVKPITYRAADGTSVPGYLTLPPGSDGRGIPAIVIPHGGPGARDEWGFDWLSQYFASRGYAVLQPNFRGSTGYGDAWFQKNGFQSWRTAIGDVTDAGRWLVAQGIADPKKLAIFGWSYGGYAALQANVIAPDLFKAAVAVAPVTDFGMRVEEWRHSGAYRIVQEQMGSGAHVREGSPLQNVAAIKVPVLMFHGDYDQNVGVRQSQAMADKLKDAGKRAELVVYRGLAHSLEDGAARADMLKKSDAFLRSAMGM